MSSLRQHFQRIKEIVDWSWTLALTCLFGYITLGQLAQLYWAMVFFGGLAASFGLFYEFSCDKLAELNFLDDNQLQKAEISADKTQKLLREFARRNPEVAQQSLFVQAQGGVTSNRQNYYTVFQQRVTEQIQRPPQRPPQSSPRPVQPSPQPPNPSKSRHTTPIQHPSPPPQPEPRPVQPPQRSSPSPPVKTRPTSAKKRSSRKAAKPKPSQKGSEWVTGHPRNGTWVKSYRRRKRRK
jgi:outer membrane biosynthesis protein TonB